MANLGPPELIIILIIVFVIFGAGKLTDIGGALGKGVREFRSATKEVEETKEELKATVGDVKEAAGKKVAGAKAQVQATADEVKEAVGSDEQEDESSDKA